MQQTVVELAAKVHIPKFVPLIILRANPEEISDAFAEFVAELLQSRHPGEQGSIDKVQPLMSALMQLCVHLWTSESVAAGTTMIPKAILEKFSDASGIDLALLQAGVGLLTSEQSFEVVAGMVVNSLFSAPTATATVSPTTEVGPPDVFALLQGKLPIKISGGAQQVVNVSVAAVRVLLHATANLGHHRLGFGAKIVGAASRHLSTDKVAMDAALDLLEEKLDIPHGVVACIVAAARQDSWELVDALCTLRYRPLCYCFLFLILIAHS